MSQKNKKCPSTLDKVLFMWYDKCAIPHWVGITEPKRLG